MQHPDELVWKSGGGCLALFGLPFLAVGLFVMASPFLPVEQQGDPMPIPAALLFGGLFATVGGGFVLGRARLILDRSRREVRRWWGLLFFPLSTTRTPLEGYDRVTFTREVRKSGKSTVTVYPVRLAGGGDELVVAEPRDALQARVDAERAAKHLNLGVEDRTVDPPAFRPAGTLDVSLRERLRKDPPPLPPRPASPGRAAVRSEGGRLIVDLPAPGLSPLHLLTVPFALVPAGFGLFFAAIPWTTEGAPLPVLLLTSGFGGLFVLGGVGFALGTILSALVRTRLEVGSELVVIERQGRLRTSRTDLATDLLEEVELTPGPVSTPLGNMGPTGQLLLLGDVEQARIPLPLPRPEQEWLRDLIRHTVAAGNAPRLA